MDRTSKTSRQPVIVFGEGCVSQAKISRGIESFLWIEGTRRRELADTTYRKPKNVQQHAPNLSEELPSPARWITRRNLVLINNLPKAA